MNLDLTEFINTKPRKFNILRTSRESQLPQIKQHGQDNLLNTPKNRKVDYNRFSQENNSEGSHSP